MEIIEELQLIKKLYSLIDICEGAYNSSQKDIYYLEHTNSDIEKDIKYWEDQILEEEKAFKSIPEKNKKIIEHNKRFSFRDGVEGAFYPFLFSFIFAAGSLSAYLFDKSTFLLITTIVLFSIVGIITLVSFISNGKQSKEDMKELIDVPFETKRYEDSVKYYNSKIAECKNKLIDPNEINKRLAPLKKVAAQLKKGKNDTQKCLNSIINSGKIHKHYSSFECVCQFIQYLDTGRCSTLEGPDGCYNKYELELRLGIIINNLEEIKASLHRIEESMYVIVNELKEINNILHDISVELDEMSQKQVNPNTLENINKNLVLTRTCAAFLIQDKLPRDIRVNMVRDVFLKQDYLK